MRDVRDSPPPVPKAQKKKKDAMEARRNKKILEREALEKRRQRQKQDGLPVELSPSPSLLEDSEDDGFEKG